MGGELYVGVKRDVLGKETLMRIPTLWHYKLSHSPWEDDPYIYIVHPGSGTKLYAWTIDAKYPLNPCIHYISHIRIRSNSGYIGKESRCVSI